MPAKPWSRELFGGGVLLVDESDGQFVEFNHGAFGDLDDHGVFFHIVDDAVDAGYAVAQRLLIYQVTDVRKPAKRLAHLIVESAQELDAAIKGLRDKKMFNQVRERIVQINTLENNGDRVYYDGLAALVSHRDDVFDFIRWKEIYELLEATTDRIEDAGDVIQRVLVSNG